MIRRVIQSTSMGRRFMSTAAGQATVEKYSSPSVILHWAMGLGVVTCVGTAKLSQWTPKEEPKKYGYTKMELMNIHKSTAVLVAAMFVPRVAFFLMKRPAHVPGPIVEKIGGMVTHLGLYGLMFALPASGFGMGYYSGKGIPFFGYTIPGAPDETKDGKFAGELFKKHKLMGEALTYLIPLHIGAVGYYFARGQNILKRMWF